MRVFFFHGVLEKKEKFKNFCETRKNQNCSNNMWQAHELIIRLSFIPVIFYVYVKLVYGLLCWEKGGDTSGMWYITRLHVGSYRNHEEYKYAHAS